MNCLGPVFLMRLNGEGWSYLVTVYSVTSVYNFSLLN